MRWRGCSPVRRRARRPLRLPVHRRFYGSLALLLHTGRHPQSARGARLRRLGFLDDDRPGLLADATGPVHVVTTATPLAEAAALAAGPARDQPLLPVVLPGRDPRFATAVSEILGALDPAALARRDPATPVGEVMSGPPASVGTGDTAAEALARLDAAGADHAVLLRDGRLAGLVTRAGLVVRASGLWPEWTLVVD